MKIFLTPKHISHTYNEQFDRISHTYLEGKMVLFFLDKIMQKTAPFSGSVPPNFMTVGILNSSWQTQTHNIENRRNWIRKSVQIVSKNTLICNIKNLSLKPSIQMKIQYPLYLNHNQLVPPSGARHGASISTLLLPLCISIG